MDSLMYHAGLLLKRAVEQTGRTPTVEHYLVAAMLLAQENGGDVDIEQMYETLADVANYDAAAHKLDREARIRQLMGQ